MDRQYRYMEIVTSTTHKDEGVITYKKGQQNNYDVTSMRTGRQSSNHFECKIEVSMEVQNLKVRKHDKFKREWSLW